MKIIAKEVNPAYVDFSYYFDDADSYGCKPEELEIYLYDGEHVVTDYRLMD